MIHELESKTNESEREHESTQRFANLVLMQSRRARPMEIIFKTLFSGLRANWRRLTLSQRVRTCVSVNWLHSFNCSIHWSRSFVVALSSIAVVEGKVSSIFVDSILTAFFLTTGIRKYMWVPSYVLHLFLEILLKILKQNFVDVNNFSRIFCSQTQRRHEVKYEGKTEM